jgi:hypothetical protein
VEWIQLARVMDRWRDLVNMVIEPSSSGVTGLVRINS